MYTRQPIYGPASSGGPASWHTGVPDLDAPFPWEQGASPEDLAYTQQTHGNGHAQGQLPVQTPAPSPSPSPSPSPTRPPLVGYAAPTAEGPDAERVARLQHQQQAAAALADNNVVVEPGRVYVVQIDQEAPVQQEDPAHPRALTSEERQRQRAWLESYSGQTAVFRANERGELEQVGDVYRSSAHPQGLGGGATTPAEAGIGIHDQNGDGSTDYAHLPSGAYEYGGRAYDHNFPIRVGERQANGRWSSTMRTPYDTDHDGVISEAERARPYESHGVNVHPGSAYGPGSAGCQNVHRDDFEGFQRTVEHNTTEREGFTYVLARRPNTGDTYRRNPYGDGRR